MTINGTEQTAEDLLKLALAGPADYSADWRKAEKAYRANPSAATFSELHAARQALRKTAAIKSL